MKLQSSDLDSILDFVETYLAEGIDQEVAIYAGVALARGIWKRDHPNTTNMPDHLKPGNVIKTINKALAERRAHVGEDES